MPLYEFVCRDCDHEVEVLVRSATETPACPDCGGEKLVKLLSVPAAPAGGTRGDSGPSSGPSGGGCGSGCGCHPRG